MINSSPQLTLAIPNRNRDLRIVERSLTSIFGQNTDKIEVVLIDYGSAIPYQNELRELLKKFQNLRTIFCPVQGQLWNKPRAINIVLRRCQTPYFMVADMDMIYHPDFVSKILNLLDPQTACYFPVGILREGESKKDLTFRKYEIKFTTNDEATGMTLFPTEKLKEINGYDEFYHGWGSEDTDVHVRLHNAGTKVVFKNDELLFLHQWHPKTYRSKDSTEAFHKTLERINARYLKLTRELKIRRANNNNNSNNNNNKWGILPIEEACKKLESPDIILNLDHTKDDIAGLSFQLTNLRGKCVAITVSEHPKKNILKNRIKGILGKKTPLFCSAEESNERLLELLIGRFRNCPYRYNFDRKSGEIALTINLPPSGLEVF